VPTKLRLSHRDYLQVRSNKLRIQRRRLQGRSFRKRAGVGQQLRLRPRGGP